MSLVLDSLSVHRVLETRFTRCEFPTLSTWTEGMDVRLFVPKGSVLTIDTMESSYKSFDCRRRFET